MGQDIASKKKNVGYFCAIASLLAITVFYVPLVSLTIYGYGGFAGNQGFAFCELGFWGADVTNIISLVATVVLVVNAVVQFFKSFSWLNLACAILTALPALLAYVFVKEGAGTGYKTQIGFPLAIIFTLLFVVLWGIEYVLELRSMRHVGRVAICGAASLLVGVILCLIPQYDIFAFGFFAISIFLLMHALLGFTFSVARKDKGETAQETNAANDPMNVVAKEDAAEKEDAAAPPVRETPAPKNGNSFATRYRTLILSILWGGIGLVVLFVCIFIGFGIFNDAAAADSVPTENYEEAPKATRNSDGESESDAEREDDDLGCEAEEYGDLYDEATTDILEGTIDGKIGIGMTLYRIDGMLWGCYYYNKNNTGDISLSGEYGEDGQITLTESVDGTVTGQFIGYYNEPNFSGTWVSADGEREMPFELKLTKRKLP